MIINRGIGKKVTMVLNRKINTLFGSIDRGRSKRLHQTLNEFVMSSINHKKRNRMNDIQHRLGDIECKMMVTNVVINDVSSVRTVVDYSKTIPKMNVNYSSRTTEDGKTVVSASHVLYTYMKYGKEYRQHFDIIFTADKILNDDEVYDVIRFLYRYTSWITSNITFTGVDTSDWEIPTKMDIAFKCAIKNPDVVKIVENKSVIDDRSFIVLDMTFMLCEDLLYTISDAAMDDVIFVDKKWYVNK